MFGVPTIRYDIKKPERQSVADPNVIFPDKLRIMQTRLQQLSCCSLRSLPHLEWTRRTLGWPGLRNRLRRFSETLGLISEVTFSTPFLKGPRRSKGLFWRRSVVSLLRRPCTIWPHGTDDLSLILFVFCVLYMIWINEFESKLIYWFK